MKYHSQEKNGFTLIEMLVSISLLALIASIGTVLLTVTLKNASKARISQLVKQEGDYAMQSMERWIRNSSPIINNCQPNMTILQFTNFDGQPMAFEFVGIGESNSYIASYSAQLTQINRLTSESVELDGGQSNYFSCIVGQEDNTPALVTISFSLKQANSSLSQEESITIPFHHTISLRNY